MPKTLRYWLLTLFIYLAATTLHAQQLTLSGQVQAENNRPLAYVNIGIKAKNIGTASDERGKFILNLEQQHLKDSLTFSAIGYEEATYPISELLSIKSLKVTLKEKVIALNEVVVRSKKLKTRKLGVTGRFPGVWGNPEHREGKDVYEFANFIKLNNRQTELLSAHFYLVSSKLDSALFRINFYKNNNGLPGERLVEKSILQKLSTKDGWVSIDLTKYDLYFTEDFFFGIEYLPAAGADRLAVSLGGKLGGRAYSRQSSLGSWTSFVGASLSSYVTVRQ